MSTRDVGGRERRVVAGADDVELAVDEAEHGDGEDVVGVEVAGVGGDPHQTRAARNASCWAAARSHRRSSRSPASVIPNSSRRTGANSSRLDHALGVDAPGRSPRACGRAG